MPMRCAESGSGGGEWHRALRAVAFVTSTGAARASWYETLPWHLRSASRALRSGGCAGRWLAIGLPAKVYASAGGLAGERVRSGGPDRAAAPVWLGWGGVVGGVRAGCVDLSRGPS